MTQDIIVIGAGMVPLGAGARGKEAEGSRSAGSVAPAGGGASFVTMAGDWTRVTVPPPVRLAFEVRGPKGPARDARIAWYGKPERTLLAVVWDERSNLGLVRFYAQETTKRLERIFEEIAQRPPDEQPDASLADGYSDEATAVLDDLF